MSADLHEVIGCVHVHTLYSDGSGSYPEVIRAAQEVKLDFLLTSDHMTLQARQEGFGGWYDDLFLMVGYEINDPDDRHHYLAFGLDQILSSEMTHTEYIKEVQNLGALGIAAHPFENREENRPIRGFPPIPWGNLDYPEITAIEIWNMMSHWMESTSLRNVVWNLVHPRSFSTFPSQRLRQWWDKANLDRKVVGVGSVDVHAIKMKLLGIFSKAIFDYKVMFQSIRTHLLLDAPLRTAGSVADTEKMITDGIASGRSFVSNHRRGDARGFRFWMETKDRIVQMGQKCRAKTARLRVEVPGKALCKIIRNGKLYQSGHTGAIDQEVGPGVYRIEVEKNKRGWIYSNHIKVEYS